MNKCIKNTRHKLIYKYIKINNNNAEITIKIAGSRGVYLRIRKYKNFNERQLENIISNKNKKRTSEEKKKINKNAKLITIICL